MPSLPHFLLHLLFSLPSLGLFFLSLRVFHSSFFSDDALLEWCPVFQMYSSCFLLEFIFLQDMDFCFSITNSQFRINDFLQLKSWSDSEIILILKNEAWRDDVTTWRNRTLKMRGKWCPKMISPFPFFSFYSFLSTHIAFHNGWTRIHSIRSVYRFPLSAFSPACVAICLLYEYPSE